MTRPHLDTWANAVADELDTTFEFDADTRDHLLRYLTDAVTSKADHIEFICDNPGTANARLKWADPRTRAVRVADYRIVDTGRFDDLNARLAFVGGPPAENALSRLTSRLQRQRSQHN